MYNTTYETPTVIQYKQLLDNGIDPAVLTNLIADDKELLESLQIAKTMRTVEHKKDIVVDDPVRQEMLEKILADRARECRISHARILEILPQKPINTFVDVIEYMTERGYQYTGVEYDERFVLGIPEYDMNVPRNLVFNWPGKEYNVKVRGSFRYNSAFPFFEDGVTDIGEKYPDRTVPLDEIKPSIFIFKDYPTNLNTHSYSFEESGYGIGFWEGLFMLDFYEEPVAYTDRYNQKTSEICKLVNDKVIPALKREDFPYTEMLVNNEYYRDDHYRYGNNEGNSECFGIKLFNRRDGLSVCFSIDKTYLTTSLVCYMSEGAYAAAGVPVSCAVEDMDLEEIVEIIKFSTLFNFNNERGCGDIPRLKAFIKQAKETKFTKNNKEKESYSQLIDSATPELLKACNRLAKQGTAPELVKEVMGMISKAFKKSNQVFSMEL